MLIQVFLSIFGIKFAESSNNLFNNLSKILQLKPGNNSIGCVRCASPSLITVEIILIMVTNFFWLLLVFRDDCKKRKFSENRESGGPARPKNNAPPL